MADDKLSDDFNANDKFPTAEFDRAIFTQDVDALKQLISELNLPKQERQDFLTAELRKACALVYRNAVNVAIIDTLIDAGGKLNQPQGHDASPFGIVCQSNDVSLLRHMIRRGADVNADVVIDQFGAAKPLHFACSHSQNPEIVAELLEHRANPNAKGFFGQTPLHALASAKPKKKDGTPADRNPIVDLLLKRGAKVDALDKWEQTPLLSLIAQSPDVKLAEKLIDAGANLKHMTRTEGSALHMAAERGLHDLVELLIRSGAPLLLKDAHGRTPAQHLRDHLARKAEESAAPAAADVSNSFRQQADVGPVQPPRGVDFGRSLNLLETAEKKINHRDVRKMMKHRWGL